MRNKSVVCSKYCEQFNCSSYLDDIYTQGEILCIILMFDLLKKNNTEVITDICISLF